jgi:hypothetical protein
VANLIVPHPIAASIEQLDLGATPPGRVENLPPSGHFYFSYRRKAPP